MIVEEAVQVGMAVVVQTILVVAAEAAAMLAQEPLVPHTPLAIISMLGISVLRTTTLILPKLPP